MIQYLSPLVSLFKLLVEGISQVSEKIKPSRHRGVQRKLIEIQLSLEDIIENAEHILSMIERSTRSTQEENRRIVIEFERMLHVQLRRIHILMDQVTDDTSQEILKVFAPNLRRNILLLTETKMGVINWALTTMYDTMGRVTVSKEGLKASVESALITWDHQRFITEGPLYLDKLIRSRKKGKVLLSDHLDEQKKILKSLILCSTNLSEFINEHVKIQDAIGHIGKKNRQ